MDVHNVFLQGDLVEEVYLEVPSGFASQEGKHVVFNYISLSMDSNRHLGNGTRNSLMH